MLVSHIVYWCVPVFEVVFTGQLTVINLFLQISAHQLSSTCLLGTYVVSHNIWTTATEPALAASPAADQLQTRQTLLPGYFFPTARLPRWFDQSRLLRSSTQKLLSVPPHNLDTAARPFSIAAPRLWNSLPLNCRTAPSVNTFKIRLKTFLFDSA